MGFKDTIEVLGGATYVKMMDCIDKVHKKSGKNKAAVFFDIVQCALRYGAGYYDYLIFEFYNINEKQRKTYMTRMKNRKLISILNDHNYSYIFDQKNVFDKRFKDFLGRQVIDLSDIGYDEFKNFVRDKEYFFAKPYIGESGKGIEKIKVSDFVGTESLYEYIKRDDKNFGVIEEVIVQHPQAAKIYPCSLNCLRIVTMVHDGKPYILYSVFKMGNGGNFVDNLESGGLACSFDLDRGVVTGQGHTSALVNHDFHPYTGIEFIGYELPFCKEIKELVKRAAMVVPEIKYVGWDVCFTENGPAIVEGNDYPAYDFPQLPDPDKPRIGLLAKIQEIMPEFR